MGKNTDGTIGVEKVPLSADTLTKQENGLVDNAGFDVETLDNSEEYYRGWKHLLPFRSRVKNKTTIPLVKASALNFASVHWLTPFIWRSYKKGTTEKDLYRVPKVDSAEFNCYRFEKFWNEEVKNNGKEGASVAKALMRLIKKRLIIAMLFTFLFACFAIVGPDSLLSLRVLTQIAELNLDQTSYDVTFNITASADPKFRKVVRFDKYSWLKLVKLNVPPHWGKVIPDIRGTGIGLMQMVTTVNYEHEFQLIPAPNRTFDLGDLRGGIITSGFNHSRITYNICPKWVGSGERSGLAVVQIDFPTGYGEQNVTYVNYVKKNMKTSSLKYARGSSGTGQFFFEYFDSTTDTHCVNFTVVRDRQIANISEHHYIKVYEYYEPMNYNQSIYELVQLRQLTVCLVCGSYQCPYCPNYAGTIQILPNNYLTIINLLLITFTKHFWDSILFK